MLLLFLQARGALNDDAYITLAYAKNLALHLHWGLIPQETANTESSPLNVVVLAAVSAATRIGHGVHPVLALGMVVVGAAMATAWGWTRVVRALRLPWAAGAIGVGLALVNPFLLSALGLEVVLMPAILVVLLAMALEGRATAFAVAGAVALLTRLDLAVFVLLVALGSEPIRRQWRRVALVVVAVAGPWFLASWVMLGSAIPDTLLIKVDQRSTFAQLDYLTGPHIYFTGRPWDVTIAFLPSVIGLVALIAWVKARTGPLAPVAAVGAGGVGYYLVYSLLGVPPYHWYYVAPITALSMVAVIFGAFWMRRPRKAGRPRISAAAATVGVLALLAVGGLAADLAHGVPWRSPVVFGNFASARDYARVGIALRSELGTATVASPGEIGTLAYFCNCAILDEFSDRGPVVRLVEHDLAHGGTLKRLLLKVNYAWLDRDQAPRRAAYRLVYQRGPGSGHASWTVWSAAYGTGHFTLVPEPRRPAPSGRPPSVDPEPVE
jgi:hypothetical protein